MTKKIFIIVYLVLIPVIEINAQTKDQTTKYRKEALEQLRGLQDFYNNKSINNNTSIDSLQSKLETLINVSKTLKDTVQLKLIANYFTTINNNLSEADSQSLLDISRITNKDLQLKFSANKISDHLSPNFVFGKTQRIKIKALMSTNHNLSGNYRLHWCSYTGRSVKDLVKKDGFISNTFANPYTIEVVMPGLITFWLKDVSTNEIYFSDNTYYDMVKPSPLLEIYFKK
ncbi:hypothetical protein [Flavobacterium microcysteis]|uniref:Uncharacterized protein n=1 Tax=Flavobacterium microcysteis TaxID=2596891 RepID=A0A501QDT6_9FLAO|nr:hypothetical protein [Flavobacterium microcysteis]TPD70534.1 hypothetical protein FJA49_06245 [Flavobacterium microcysteis]